MSGPNGISGSRRSALDRFETDDAKLETNRKETGVAPWAKEFEGYGSSDRIRLSSISARTPLARALGLNADDSIARQAAAKADQVASVVHSERQFSDLGALTGEIFRLKSEAGKAQDPAMRQAVKQRLSQLQTQWVGMAKAAGMREPAARLDVLTASREQITQAFLWSEAGGITPRGELAADGGKAFRASVRDGVTLMTRGFDALVEAHRGEPETQMYLLRRDLVRLGDRSPCLESDTVASLRQRRATILSKTAFAARQRDADAVAKQPVIGLDGYVGMPADVALYETSEKIKAMNPGTTLGSIMATYLGGDDIQRMRQLGEAGNAVEVTVDRRGRAPVILPAPEQKKAD